MAKNRILTMQPAIFIDELTPDIWTTKAGERIHYKKLEEGHLNNIISMLRNNLKKGKTSIHLEPLIKEQQRRLMRNSKAGKILYGTKKKV